MNNNFSHKIADYLNGKLSPEEAREFLEHYVSNEEEETLNLEFEKFWNEKLTLEEHEEWDPSTLFSKIQESKENHRFLITPPHPKTLKKSRIRYNLSLPSAAKIAASIVLILASIVCVKLFSPGDNPDPSPKVVEIMKTNPEGQKSTIFLSDGSRVILNSASTISYPSKFDKDQRIVTLSGEAFFQVTKDPNKPFIVKAGDIMTTVLGTSFNVNTLCQQTEVALVTGKIVVENIKENSEKLVLTPGESALLNSKSGKLEKSQFDLKTKVLWKDGIIHFENTSLKDAIVVLERWYGVDISVENLPQEKLYCTGTFKNDYLNNVLESIGYSLGFKYHIDDKKVMINF